MQSLQKFKTYRKYSKNYIAKSIILVIGIEEKLQSYNLLHNVHSKTQNQPKKFKGVGNRNMVVMHAFEELLRTPLEFGYGFKSYKQEQPKLRIKDPTTKSQNG